MSLTALQTYVAGVLNGLTTPALVQQGLQPAEAVVAPPVVLSDAMSAPAIFVWGGRMEDVRRTGPRASLQQAGQPTLPLGSAGLRRVTWDLDVWIVWIAPSAPDDLTFPLLIDAVRKQIATIPMPAWLEDQQTGDRTQLVAIGERMGLDYSTPAATADQRNLFYAAALTVGAEEWYQL